MTLSVVIEGTTALFRTLLLLAFKIFLDTFLFSYDEDMKSQVYKSYRLFLQCLLAVTENVQNAALSQFSFLITITTIKQIFVFSLTTYIFKDGSKAEETSVKVFG